MPGNLGAETLVGAGTSAARLSVQECIARAEVLLDEAAALRRELLIGSDGSDNCGCALEIVRHGIYGVRGRPYSACCMLQAACCMLISAL